jgi:uncharacterized cupin superfamily protein
MKPLIVNLDSLEFHAWSEGQYAGRRGSLGVALGSTKLGYSLMVVPLGKRAYPFHSHRANEEMFLILEGEGELRLADATHPLRKGDVIACPAGGPETAHQIVNRSATEELKYLAVSTLFSPEICEYPESGKFSVTDFTGPGGRDDAFRHVGRPELGVDYWE